LHQVSRVNFVESNAPGEGRASPGFALRDERSLSRTRYRWRRWSSWTSTRRT